jgi:hypothetical protein
MMKSDLFNELYLRHLPDSGNHVTKATLGWVPVPHAYNPNYLRDKDLEDHGSKQAQTNSTCDPISKKPNTK